MANGEDLGGLGLWLGPEWGDFFADPIFTDPRIYSADLPFVIEVPREALSSDLVRFVTPEMSRLSGDQLLSLMNETGVSLAGPGTSELQSLMVQAGLAPQATLAPGATPEFSFASAEALLDSLQVNPAGEVLTPTGTVLGKVNDFLGTPGGKILAMLGLGAAGVGVSSLLTGGDRTFTPPAAPPPTPAAAAGQAALERALGVPGGTLSGSVPGATGAPAFSPYLTLGAQQPGQASLEQLVRTSLAGEANLADLLGGRIGRETLADIGEAPLQATTRRLAYGQLLGLDPATLAAGGPMPTTFGATSLLQPGTLAATSDPIRANLEEQILRVLGGQFANPDLERQLADRERILRATLQQQVGKGYETSTPGIQALAENALLAERLRGAERRAELSTLAPMEAARREQEVALPEQSLARREAIRRSQLSDVLGLTGFGRTEPLTTGATLTSLVSPNTLLNPASAEADRAYDRNLQTQLALQSFGAQQTERANLAQQIGQLFGMAGGVGLLSRA